jgi:hypothetical protein
MSRLPAALQLFGLIGATCLLLYLGNSSKTAPTDKSASTTPIMVNPEAPALAKLTQIVAPTFTNKDLSEYLTVHKTEKTSAGITLIPLSGPDSRWAINEKGILIKEWKVDAERLRVLKNGNLLVGFGSKFRDNAPPWKDLLNSLAEYTWDGELVWQHTAPNWIHHDHQRLANGNTLYLSKTKLPESYAAKINDPHRRKLGQIADSIIEVDTSGNTVWQWHAWEGFDINYCGTRSCTETIKEFAPIYDDPTSTKKAKARALKKITDWAHFNTVTIIPENKWYDAGDTRFKPGNLIVMPRKFKTVYVIDRETKKPVWEYSGDYKGGLGGSHEPYMIAKGFPGAGNILIFDNGGLGSHPTESFVLEVNPSNKQLEWVYDVGPAFNIRTRGGAQRLRNGNTLISEDPTGKVFEVTPENETVWEFRTPHPVNRAKRYDWSYCNSCDRG